MDIFEKNKIKNIQNYIVDLYNLRLKNGEYNAEAEKMFNLKAFDNWCVSLGSYSEEHIKGAINQYHQTKNNKTAPRIGQIKEILEKDYPAKSDITIEPVVARKPVCPIAEWQDDWDYVLKQASIQGICFIPYYSNQEEVIIAHKEFIKKPFATLKAKSKWAMELDYAKSHDFNAFKSIENYHWLVHYTWAYRIGALSI